MNRKKTCKHLPYLSKNFPLALARACLLPLTRAWLLILPLARALTLVCNNYTLLYIFLSFTAVTLDTGPFCCLHLNFPSTTLDTGFVAFVWKAVTTCYIQFYPWHGRLQLFTLDFSKTATLDTGLLLHLNSSISPWTRAWYGRLEIARDLFSFTFILNFLSLCLLL